MIFKRNKKLTVIALVAMLFMAIAVTFLTFSHADEEESSSEQSSGTLLASSLVDTNTNIDNIINNSYDNEDTSKRIYNIIEIGSVSLKDGDGKFALKDGEKTSFGEYVTSDKFKEYVLNGNKTISRVMNENCVDYTYYSVAYLSSLRTQEEIDNDTTKSAEQKAKEESKETALVNISNADFVYVSNDAVNKYSSSNDLSEDVYDILHTYAIGDYKPLVIDTPSATSAGGSSSTEITESMKTLAKNVYDASGRYYYTFDWNTGANMSAEDFLAHRSGSLYLGINGTKNSSKWLNVSIKSADATTEATSTEEAATTEEETSTEEGASTEETASTEEASTEEATSTEEVSTEETTTESAPAVETKTMSRILVISANGDKLTASDGKSMIQQLIAGNKKLDDTYVDTTGKDVAGTVYELTDGTILKKYGYNAKYTMPQLFSVEEVKLTDVASSNFDNYDLIVIDSSCSGGITDEVYTKFAAAMYGSISIVYDSAMSQGEEATVASGEAKDIFDSNYEQLFYMVASSDYVSMYDNVMVTNQREFGIITSSSSSATAKVIADLINASSFRGIGGSGSSSSDNKYTVLELQPCYPIDLELAAKIGSTEDGARSGDKYPDAYGPDNYYTVPGQVANNKTKEELADGTEYYAWELSPAKIADVTGLSVDKINVVHMSTEEFKASKDSILGTYDLIYIGGNTSALKEADEYLSLVGLAGWSGVLKDHTIKTSIKELPIYTVYSHNGDIVYAMAPNYDGVVKGKVAANSLTLNGKNVDSFAVLNGNDITYNELQDLKEYINSNMPVVISKDAAAAYQDAAEYGYYQNSIDPDCNMMKVLTACQERANGGYSNILWGFNQDGTVYTDNDGGRLGKTATGYVSVFAGHDKEAEDTDIVDDTVKTGDRLALKTLITKSNTRPKITVTASPAIYNMYDASTKLAPGPVTFKYKITGDFAKAELYIDDNGNSVFTDDGVAAVGNESTLTYTVSSNYSGPMYWELRVTGKSGAVTSKKGISFIKNTEGQTQTVRVLQIMPAGKLGEPGGNGSTNGDNNLYFCPICQQSYRRLTYNPVSNAGDRANYSAMYGGNFADTDDGLDNGGNDVYTGRHEHFFGIVSYNSGLDLPKNTPATITKYGDKGRDDWDYNLADEVSDLYDFDIDIVKRDEFEAYDKEVREAYDFSSQSTAEKQSTISNFEKAVDKTDEYFTRFGKDTDGDGVLDDANGDGIPDTIDSANGITADEMLNLKLTFIKQREMEQERDRYWQLYQYMQSETPSDSSKRLEDESGNAILVTTADQEKILVEKLQLIVDRADNHLPIDPDSPTYNQTFNRYDKDGNLIYTKSENAASGGLYEDTTYNAAYVKSEVQRIIDNGYYWDLYSIANRRFAEHPATAVPYIGESIDPYYYNYVIAKDKELYYRDEYKRYDRLANYENWVEGCYDTVVIGASEDFAGDDFKDMEALATLKQYIQDDGHVLLFHDTLSKFKDAGSVNLTAALIEDFGMDVYHNELDEKLYVDTSVTVDVPSVYSSDNMNINFKVYNEDGTSQMVYFNNLPSVSSTTNTASFDFSISIYDDNSITNVKDKDNPIYKSSDWKNTTSKLNSSDISGVNNDDKIVVNFKLTGTYEENSFYWWTDPNANQWYDGSQWQKGSDRIVKDYDLTGRKVDLIINSNGYSEYGNQIMSGTIGSDGTATFEIPILKYNSVTTNYPASDMYYLPYTTYDGKTKEDYNYSDVYFMTNLSTRTDNTKYGAWKSDMDKVFQTGCSNCYLSNIALSDLLATASFERTILGFPYKYADVNWSAMTSYNKDAQFTARQVTSYGTTAASQNNRGIVTLYPFTLSDELAISGTHSQAYALDLEDSDMTVWYSLAACNNAKEMSSAYAADPRDGQDNYFIYTYKNVNYCGAGHSKVTGIFKDNNDERKLYINIICNSVKKSIKQPSIVVYDYDQDSYGDVIKMDNSGNYYAEFDDSSAYPEFSFKVNVDNEAKLRNLKIYYDLDYLDSALNDYAANEYHPLIVEWDANSVTAGVRKNVYRYDASLEYLLDDEGRQILETIDAIDADGNAIKEQHAATKLKLQPEYFLPYNNEYTYIVIRAEDTKGNVVYQRIKIKLLPHLFDLT
ncbi:MAG: DUF5057 domain-containing protein [Lachnospiraceae bacterium]|nr:DUF5057 domain-containing protein [Lachnospiraceae bacterium]